MRVTLSEAGRLGAPGVRSWGFLPSHLRPRREKLFGDGPTRPLEGGFSARASGAPLAPNRETGL